MDDLGAALTDALEREPSLDEVREYGLDGGRGTNLNTLQWRLDLIRALATPPGSSSPDAGTPEWAVFHDEDGVWRIVTTEGADVTWPEMGEADVERVVAEHNRLVTAAPSREPGDSLDVDRLARVLVPLGGFAGHKAADVWREGSASEVAAAIAVAYRATGASEATPEEERPCSREHEGQPCTAGNEGHPGMHSFRARPVTIEATESRSGEAG